MFRMVTIDEEPFHTVPYRFPRTGGGVHIDEFHVYGAVAKWLDGLLITSDLTRGGTT